MKLFFLIFVLTILVIKCDGEEKCKSNNDETTAKKLYTHLLCQYDTDIRPTLKAENSTLITFRLAPQYIEFEEQQNILIFHTWLDVLWKDEHLNWKPEDWNNTRQLQVKSFDIWTPTLTVFNHGDMTNIENGISESDCMVEFDGSVECVTPTKYTSHCPTDYDEWPYDKHNCSIHIGAWMFEYAEMSFKLDDKSIFMGAFRSNNQWDVHVSAGSRTDRRLIKDDEGEMSVKLVVFLQRHGTRLAIVYVLPIIVLMILTLIVLWLDSQSLERILVACLNFICHILGLSDLHYYFPTSGSLTTPKILLFYETSVGLAAYALLLTCLLRKLRSLNVSAPMWIASGTALVLNNAVTPYLGLIVSHPREAGILDESENGETKAPKDRTWQELATILEWLSFAVALLTYVIMLGIVLPPNAPKGHASGFWF